MKIIISVLILLILVFSYVFVSYYVLRYFGVTERLKSRAIKFGSVMLLVQTVFQQIFFYLGAGWLGAIVGLIGSFYYVKSVLNIPTLSKLLIIFIMPTIALMLAAPILFASFYALW
ncbi:MAG: hypothetical protein V4660_16335 [Pseudomonadota bacterium]